MTLLNRLERLEAGFASRASERAESDYALYNKVGRAAVATLSDADLTLLDDADPPDLSPERHAAEKVEGEGRRWNRGQAAGIGS